MPNIYHLLHTHPSLEEEDTYIEVEKLAKQLVESGRLRIDIDYNTLNFVRFLVPEQGIEIFFTERELHTPTLIPKTTAVISYALQRKHTSPAARAIAVEKTLLRLRADLKKYNPISSALEMKLARVIVQSTHPVVMMLALWERIEIFISYSYAIGDLLEMESWQSARNNNGMQRTDGRNAAIYISAAGDPFGAGEKGAVSGNGLPALARMMVIGAQEFGHYSDIRRNNQGRQVSRHSANFGGTQATEGARIARNDDIATLKELEKLLTAKGLMTLYDLEEDEKFYRKINRKGLKLWLLKWRIYRGKQRFLHAITSAGIKLPPPLLLQTNGLATYLCMALADMKFNLSPKAAAYRHEDPIQEEAIACIEAVARVPQQVIKWGEVMTKMMMPNLYNFYYLRVIPSCIQSYEQLYNTPYYFTFTKKPRSIHRYIEKVKDMLVYKRKG